MLRTGGSLAIAAAISGAVAPAASAVASGGRWDRLRSRLRGDLVLPRDPRYGVAKQLQIAQYDAVNPAAIAYCAGPADVRTCIQFARRYDVPVRARSGGHNLNGWSTGPGLIIDVSRLNHVTVGAETINLGPGVQAVDALRALEPHGRQIVTGTCPTVCAGGFLSGGGVGWQTRKFGIGSDRVVSALVALADGRVTRVSARAEPDLFWALRGGGGGNFGIVLDFEVRPIDAPRMTQYSVLWPGDRAPEVFSAWQAWCGAASHNVGSSLLLMPAIDAPGNAPLALVMGGYLGPQADLERELAELAERIGTPPVVNSAQEKPFAAAMISAYGCESLTVEQCHRVGHNPNAMLPRTGFQRQSYRLLDRPLDADGVAATVAAWAAGEHPRLHSWLQCIALGGAANEVRRTATAYVHRDARFLVGYQVGADTSPDPEDAAAAAEWTDQGAAVLDRYASGCYVNFPSTKLRGDWGHANYGENLRRLRNVKRQYDPEDFFRHPGGIR